MNNSYENNLSFSNYYYNNDSNFDNNYNQTNDKRFESFYDNYNDFQSNIEYKIATKIAYNYRQPDYGWVPNSNWSQSGYNSYFDPNYHYKHLESLNRYSSSSSVNSQPIQTHYSYNEIQNYYYSDKRDSSFETTNQRNDSMIPTTVEEIENKIKTEREFDEILSNGSEDNHLDCLPLRQQIIEINENCNNQREESSKHDIILLESQTIPKKQKIKKKSRKSMSFEEIIRDKRESNRLAAIKCRQKKLSQLNSLDIKSKLLNEENERFEQKLKKMRAQLLEFKMTLLNHRNNGCPINPLQY